MATENRKAHNAFVGRAFAAAARAAKMTKIQTERFLETFRREMKNGSDKTEAPKT